MLDINNVPFDEIYNQTFSGLTLFYRDTTLTEDLISKYEVGQILMERGFIDMSFKGEGLETNLRYLIASSNATDLSFFPESEKWGHILLPAKSFFKVLDIYRIGDKTQIFLLQIPLGTVTFFASADTNIEEEITQKARTSFDTKANAISIPELQTPEWRKRTEFPIGMNDKGEFFNPADIINQEEAIDTDSENEQKEEEVFYNPKAEEEEIEKIYAELANKPVIENDTQAQKENPWWKF